VTNRNRNRQLGDLFQRFKSRVSGAQSLHGYLKWSGFH